MMRSIQDTPRGLREIVGKTWSAQNAWCYVRCPMFGQVHAAANDGLCAPLVTGACGFLGRPDCDPSEQTTYQFRSLKILKFPSCCGSCAKCRHLVAALLTSGECSKIFCLVRAADPQSAQRRVEEVPRVVLRFQRTAQSFCCKLDGGPPLRILRSEDDSEDKIGRMGRFSVKSTQNLNL